MTTSQAQRSRWRSALAVASLFGLTVMLSGYGDVAGAQTKQVDPKTQRDEVRRRKAQVAAQLDLLKASDAELTEALETLDAHLRLEEAALQNAEAEVARATKEADDIRRRQRETQEQLDTLRALITKVAVDTYARPPIDDRMLTLSAVDLNQAVRKQALIDIVNTANRDVAEHVRAVKTELDDLEAAHSEALTRAEAARAEVQVRVSKVAEARAQQQKAMDALEDRIDRLLGESNALAALDKRLSDEIARQAAAAAAAAARARASSSTRAAFSGPLAGDLVSVRGIVVHKSIAGNLERLLAAAQGAGISLGGSGYRDPAAQIALRQAHCGTSYYAIYQMPAFQCSPPTARPGTSNHERGLAIDFTSNGTVLTRSTAAFRWLAGNAGSYGLRNLPSEPWHWSTDGN
jgi:peptidoglycan hydrolase CwlO-like protein